MDQRIVLFKKLSMYIDLKKLLKHFEDGGGLPREFLPVILEGRDKESRI